MPTIMVVDDSNFARRSHRRVLESAGHVVLEAATGMSAVEGFFVNRPDLVLLDLTMEDMTGFEVLQHLREIDRAVRVIVISADVQRSTAQLVSDAGAVRFLGKPVSPDQLLETVRNVLSEVAP